MTYIALILIMGIILILYLGALLIFTPYEEEDKYVLKIMESGYRLHMTASQKGNILKFMTDFFAKGILIFVYFVLKDRKYTSSVKTIKKEDEDVQ